MASEALPDRRQELIIGISIITVLSTGFAIWRLIVRFPITLSSWKHGISDYLMFVAIFLNAAANIGALYSTKEGYGRVDADPFWTPEHKRNLLRITYATLVMNTYSMFLVKLSISAYLISLYFSASYKTVIWMTMAVVCICNFLLPAITFHGQCTSVSMMWDERVEGTCWPTVVRVVSAYTQAAANVLTDIVFTASPLIYLKQVTLPKRTRCGIRIVFLLCFFGTGLSIFKIWQVHEAQATVKDTAYNDVRLGVISSWEVGVCMIAANLPPLRKTFHHLLEKVFPPPDEELKTPRLPFSLSTYRSNNSSNRMRTYEDDRMEWRMSNEVESSNGSHSGLVGPPSQGTTTLITADNVNEPFESRRDGWKMSSHS